MQIFLLWQKYQFWNKECYFLYSIKNLCCYKIDSFFEQSRAAVSTHIVGVPYYFYSFFYLESQVTIVG